MSDEPHTSEARVVSLAQELCDRHRRGEHPTIEEYAARYPELAAEIRELFPMLCMLEDLGPAGPGPSSVAAGPTAGPLKRLGEYRIIREIGRGGMGVVYEAEQETLRRRVAIKVLPFQAFQDPQHLDRFRIEAQASARLHHANIVPVFGVGEDQGVHYYVMQFIRGQTLAEVMREVRRLRAEESRASAGEEDAAELSAASVAKSLFVDEVDGKPAQREPDAALLAQDIGSAPPMNGRTGSSDSTTSITRDPRGVYCRSIARIALQVAEGLAYAHNEGILHRDIKPSNLLLDLKGTVWITDFGLAKIQDSAELTATGGLVGTLRYMAPERFKGKGDARCDVYGLGVTLYELLTLRPAFPSNDRAEVLRTVTESQPPAPRKLDPAIPRDLETIVLKAMAREPKDRYASAAALADDLRRFLSFEPVSARRASAAERVWRWCQREPATAGLTGVSLLLLVSLAVGSMLYAVHLDAERNRTAERLVISKLQEGRAWRLSREPGSRQRSLDALKEAATPATAREVRSEVIGSLALADLVEIARREEPALHRTIDPEVERVAVMAEDGSIRVYAGIGSASVVAELPRDSRRASYILLSPGGRLLAVCYEQAAWVLWAVDRGQRLFECKAYCEPPFAAFDAKSSRFVHVDTNRSLVVRQLPDGALVQRLEAGFRPHVLAFDAPGRRLAAAGCGANQNTVNIYELETGSILSRLFHPSSAWGVAWHPDGKRVAVGCNDHNVHVWDAESGKSLLRLRGHIAEVTQVYFGAGGALLASSGWDNRTLIWHADTGTLLTEAAGLVTAFSSADRRLGFNWRGGIAGGLAEWRVEGGDVSRILHAPVTGKGPNDIAVSPDGRWLAAACVDRGLRVWSLESPGESHQADAGTLMSVCFHPDGTALWTGTFEGLYKWPLRRPAEAHEWTLGPAVKLANGAARSLTIAADGRRAAMALGNGQLVIRDLDAGGAVLGSFAHPAADRCDLSSSGRWLVSSTFHGEDVRVWNAATGAMEKGIPTLTARAAFSPDERWLAVLNGQELTVFEAGSWKERLRAPRVGAGDLAGPIAFSRDGRHIAFARSRTLLSLLRVEDGEELARIESPAGREELTDLSFSLDQGLLVAAVPKAVRIWNLRLIRRELRARGLDWGPDESIMEPPGAEPPRLRLDSGGLPPGEPYDFPRGSEVSRLLDVNTQRVDQDPTPDAFSARAAILERQGDWAAALADLDRALETSPADARILVRRGAVLGRLGKPEEALKDCEDAVALCCRSASPWSPPEGHRSACPTFREALRARARAQGSLGLEHVEGAMRSWRDLLGLEPEDREAQESIPWLFVLTCCKAGATAAGEAANSSSLALSCAEKNHRGAPRNPVFLRDLGAVKYHLGRLEEAESLLEEAWRLNARMVSAAFHLAMVHHRRGEAVKARAVFEAASTTLQTSPLPPGAANERMARIHSFARSVLEEAPVGQDVR